MKTKSIEWWNSLKKNDDTDVTAIEGDVVCYISGIAFLIQRQNDGNNVVCWKVKTTKKDLVSIFSTFRAFCQKNKIQYLRIEGHGKHHYKMLNLLYKYSPEGAGLAYAVEESKECKSNIWYVKTY
jgi:hypothetical protein